MPFTNNPYATLAQVKSALDLQTTQYDTWIETDLLPEAQDAIDKEVGYPFQTDGTAQSPSARTYNGNDGPQLLIDDCIQIVQVQEVVYNVILGTTASVTSQTRDITADVVLGPANRSPGYLIRRLSGLDFTLGYNNYTIGGVWGQPAIPDDITRMCIRLTAHYFLQRQASYSDRLSEQGNVRVQFSNDIPKDILRGLRRYKRTIALTRSR
jgi:hypothetical protein